MKGIKTKPTKKRRRKPEMSDAEALAIGAGLFMQLFTGVAMIASQRKPRNRKPGHVEAAQDVSRAVGENAGESYRTKNQKHTKA